jgi:curved DNA-binding protein
MTDYYKILGVNENAGPDEIKKAYRSLANKHHPDKGGDQSKFKDISVAYDNLSDPQKRAQYDQQRQFGDGMQFHFNTGGQGFDPFGGMFGGGNPFPQGHPFGDIFGQMRGAQQRRNRDLNINCHITLEESFTGKQIEASFQLPSGRQQTVSIDLPAGVAHGDTIRYSGMGDDSIPQMPRGNLNVTVTVGQHPKYERRGDDLFTNVEISPIEAMIGCRKTVKTLTGSTLDLDIRAGVETGVEFASHGNGFKNLNTQQRGRFVSIVHIVTPKVTDPSIVQQLKDLDARISKK